MKLSKKQKQQIGIFKTELLEKNQSINLFSRKEPKQQLKLLFDQAFLTGQSLSLILDRVLSPVLDIGSGNGFPGLFMGILYPKTTFYLCERSRKKSEFLKNVLNQAALPNVEVFCTNAEDIKESFSVILSQAALPTSKMLKLLNRLLSSKGQAFLWKSSRWKADWPEKSLFSPEVFKTYKLGSVDQILLKVVKS